MVTEDHSIAGLDIDPTAEDPYTQALKADFKNFLYACWKHLGLPEPTRNQYQIADYLQHGPRRLIVEAFRGEGKSWITSAFVCWLLFCNPQIRILVVSASKARADDFVIFVRRLIAEWDLLAHLIPKTDRSTRDSRISFDVGPANAAHAPSVKSLGITSQIAGSRADVIIGDDIEVPNNSATEGMREKLHIGVSEFDSVLTPGGRVCYLGTPQTFETVYNVLQERGYACRIWPARYPTELESVTYNGNLCPQLQEDLASGRAQPGDPTDPMRFDSDDLAERALSNGRLGWQLQFMLNTHLADEDRFPLKLCDLVVTDLDPDQGPSRVYHSTAPESVCNELPNVGFTGDRFYRPHELGISQPYQGALLSIDPAGKGADETAWCVTKVLNGYIFLLAWGGFDTGYALETLRALALLALKYKVNMIEAEENFGGGMFLELLKPVMRGIHRCQMEEIHHHIQKEKRIIDTLEPVMGAHRLIVDKSVVVMDKRDDERLSPAECLKYEGFRQMTHMTRERGALRHDDRIDVLAMAVAYWINHMAKDADDEVKEDRARKLDEELEIFMDSVLGGQKRQKGWLDRGPLMGR